VVPAQIYEWEGGAETRIRAQEVQDANRGKFQQAFAGGLAVLGYERDAHGATENFFWQTGTKHGPTIISGPSEQAKLKVEAITLREIQMPLVHFFETSFGRTTERRILLLTAHCEGVEGWGECVAGEDPNFSSEWTDSVWSTIKRHLASEVLGRTIGAAHEVAPLMARTRGHRMAKAAIENALWDAEAQQKQLPLWKLLGGTVRRSSVAFPSASRTPSSNCWRKFKRKWTLGTAESN